MCVCVCVSARKTMGGARACIVGVSACRSLSSEGMSLPAMYMGVCVCVCVHWSVSIKNVKGSVLMCIYLFKCVLVFFYVCMCACVPLCASVCMCLCTCVCV